ncbi:MAG: NAD(P)/FAD-dependent oxidoreductase [Clostridiales Family XIII bacterium]|jgi:2,4-dienoyl-CoA reductase-like NADH-dependent reductase (Old Yellow Enzyme family)/thioredoxin reductase|nr:NAD(P)/FAD-dependent oxidoreductase [Clostridiales Family XIII bacterium]
MDTLKFPRLFEPIQLGRTLFRHRSFSSPQDIYRLTYEGFLDPEGTAFYERKALGGYAAVTLGDFFVDSAHGRSHQFQLVGDDIKGRGSLTRTANAIKRHGAAAGVELNHAGKNAHLSLDSQGFVWGVTAGETESGGEIREMDDERIAQIIECYAAGAAFAVQCGYNFISIHMGHGWLPAQFMSPADNQRKDGWGGTFENRMRFPLALLGAVRRRIGAGVPIEVRLSGDEAYPGGYDIEYAVEIAKTLDGHVDILHVSAGHHEYPSASMVTHPPLFAPDGVNVHLAAEIKKHVKTAVGTVGALTDPAHMEEILASGQADILNLGRQTLADPDLPLKARTGHEDEINRCLRCMSCFSTSTSSGIFYCATNPEIGHESDSMNETPPPFRKKVLVIGGGVGGMQAALTCAQRGHEVILCEKADELGGTLLCERGVPFKDKIDSYLARQALRLSRQPVDIRLGTEATETLVREIAPDAIIAALGARPVKPPIPGIDGANVHGAEAVFRDIALAGQRVVILGGGLVGLELGIHLAQNGRKVSVVEMLDTTLASMGEVNTSDMIDHPELLAPGTNIVHGIALGEQMKRLPDLALFTSTKALRITDAGVTVEDAEGQREIAADTVVYAVGYSPLREEALAFGALAPEFYVLGDCVQPANIMAATALAWQAARDIGRI